MSLKNYSKLNDSEKESVIKDLYEKQNLSLAVIADQLGTYANKIRRDAIKFGVQLKDKSAAQQNALSSGRHKHPTKGTQRNDTTKEKIGKAVLKSWEELSDADRTNRREIARQNWQKLSEDEKDMILKSANDAVRLSSKIGSKLERYLFTRLLQDGFKVDFHKEQILSNTKLQIDIFLPTMNVAVEVDGPSHFKEVWGENALKKNITYDNKKTGLILGKGLALIRIRQTMDFSKSRADLIYDKLLDVLQGIRKQFPQSGDREIKLGDNEL